MAVYDENGFLGGLIEQWVESHQESFVEIFALAKELNRECHRFLDGRSVDPGSELQITTAVLFARMLELYQAIVLVVDRGMAAPARILFRAFLEAFFHFSTIYRDCEYLDVYLKQFHVQRKALVYRIRNSKLPLLEGLRQLVDESLLSEIKETIKQEGARKVSIEEVAKKANLYEIYVTAYAVLSRAVHSSPSDLESHLRYNAEKEVIEGFRYGPCAEETARAICLAGMCMIEALEQISNMFEEDRRESCSKLKESFQRVLHARTGEGAASKGPAPARKRDNS